MCVYITTCLRVCCLSLSKYMSVYVRVCVWFDLMMLKIDNLFPPLFQTFCVGVIKRP